MLIVFGIPIGLLLMYLIISAIARVRSGTSDSFFGGLSDSASDFGGGSGGGGDSGSSGGGD